MTSEDLLSFIPSRAEGLPDVSEVVVHPDYLELKSADRWVRICFTEIARWPRPTWLWRSLFRLGWRARWLPVADRDWFASPPSQRFFAFYTSPKLVVCMPADEPTEGYAETYFVRMQQVMLRGGFSSYDLG